MVSAKVLVVEDESIVGLGIIHKLEKNGHTAVDMVASGKDAIEAAHKYLPDIILMDIVLKGDMDGIEAAHIIHEKLDIPIIYLTAYADEEMLMRARVTEPYGYIIKPFKSSELNANIEMAYYKHRLAKKQKEVIKEKILAEFYDFIVKSIPTSCSQSELEMRNLLSKVFAERLDEEMKPGFSKEMDEKGIDENSDGEKIFESYFTWLARLFGNFGIRVGFTENSPHWYFELDNCPWIDEAKKNPIFCLNCHAMINRSFEWTNLEGEVKKKATIASGAPNCIFTFSF